MTDELDQGRPAPTELDIHPLIRYRWSPRAVANQPVEAEKLRVIFEAARWAPSSYNEQPWRFLLATRDEPEWLERLQGYLSEGNAWARKAPVLIASAYRTRSSHNDRPNRVAMRDLGAAEENMFLQTFDLGLVMHQMEGFDHERLKRELLPDEFEPGAMTAIGYPGEADELPDKLQTREERERKRVPVSEFVFGPEWGKPSRFLTEA